MKKERDAVIEADAAPKTTRATVYAGKFPFKVNANEILIKEVTGTVTRTGKAGTPDVKQYSIGRLSLPGSWIGKTVICIAIDTEEETNAAGIEGIQTTGKKSR